MHEVKCESMRFESVSEGYYLTLQPRSELRGGRDGERDRDRNPCFPRCLNAKTRGGEKWRGAHWAAGGGEGLLYSGRRVGALVERHGSVRRGCRFCRAGGTVDVCDFPEMAATQNNGFDGAPPSKNYVQGINRFMFKITLR